MCLPENFLVTSAEFQNKSGSTCRQSCGSYSDGGHKWLKATVLREKECVCESSTAFTEPADTHTKTKPRPVVFPSTVGTLSEVPQYFCCFQYLM